MSGALPGRRSLTESLRYVLGSQERPPVIRELCRKEAVVAAMGGDLHANRTRTLWAITTIGGLLVVLVDSGVNAATRKTNPEERLLVRRLLSGSIQVRFAIQVEAVVFHFGSPTQFRSSDRVSALGTIDDSARRTKIVYDVSNARELVSGLHRTLEPSSRVDLQIVSCGK